VHLVGFYYKKVHWYLVTDVRVCLTLEDGTDRLSRNVGDCRFTLLTSKKDKILSRDVPGLTAVRETRKVSDSVFLFLFYLSALLPIDTV